MSEFDAKRYLLYLELLSKYNKRPSKRLRDELIALKNGFIPLKYMEVKYEK